MGCRSLWEKARIFFPIFEIQTIIIIYIFLGLPQTWRWGDLETQFEYDRHNRLASVASGGSDYSKVSYLYKGDSFVPEKVTIPSGGAFVFSRNDLGGLEYIMTPRGHIHGRNSQMSLSLR